MKVARPALTVLMLALIYCDARFVLLSWDKSDIECDCKSDLFLNIVKAITNPDRDHLAIHSQANTSVEARHQDLLRKMCCVKCNKSISGLTTNHQDTLEFGHSSNDVVLGNNNQLGITQMYEFHVADYGEDGMVLIPKLIDIYDPYINQPNFGEPFDYYEDDEFVNLDHYYEHGPSDEKKNDPKSTKRPKGASILSWDSNSNKTDSLTEDESPPTVEKNPEEKEHQASTEDNEEDETDASAAGDEDEISQEDGGNGDDKNIEQNGVDKQQSPADDEMVL